MRAPGTSGTVRFCAPEARADGSRIRLPPDEAHHLTRVLRLGLGARIGVFNGHGDEWEGRVETIDRAAVTVRLDRRVEPLAEPVVEVTLAIGLLKGDQMDVVIRDATALGAQAIAPVASAHVTVPDRAWKSGGAVVRWRRVAVAAAKQCGRTIVPEVFPVQPFEAAIGASAADLIVMALEPAAAGLPELDSDLPPQTALVLVGPEGGWSADEITRAAARGARGVRLGPRRLRAELAPAVLLSALWTRWGW